MSESSNIFSLAKRWPVGHQAASRRATDRLVRLWQSAESKQSIMDTITETNLWDHSFLLVIDSELDYSVIIDSGSYAARGLALGERRVRSLSHLPPEFAKRLHQLGLRCRENRVPVTDNSEMGRPKGVPVRRFRMALVPLVRSKVRGSSMHVSASNMLGVFTYL